MISTEIFVFIRSKGGWGPRGEYFDWCRLREDGTIWLFL